MFKKTVCLFLAVLLLGSLSAYAANDTYSMKTSEAGIAFIKYYEGFRATVYTDSSGYAIGYGTHCNPSDFPDPITEVQADTLLRDVLSVMEAKVNAMAEKMGITLTQNQFDALMSLTYNLGTGWMTSNYSLYNMLASGISHYSDYEIINTFGRYCHVNGQIVDQIAWRRLAEAKLFLYSDYKTGGTQNYEFECNEDPDADSDILFKADGGLTICKYSDTDYTDWFYRYLSPLTLSGVVQGYDDQTFRPESSVTCGEALKTILLAAGYGVQEPTGSHWASGYLTFAEDNAIIVRGDITDLDAPISRNLVAEIAANALRLTATVTLTSASDSPFSDTGNGYVLALYDAGIITGSYNDAGELVYLPDNNLKRSEICAVIWRIEQSR
jgi:GH24 family phage-related lysozyme (muramidase)